MINEIETRLFWQNIQKPKFIENEKKDLVITKLDFNFDETKILIGGCVFYNGELFKSVDNQHIIEISLDDKNWYIFHNKGKKEMIYDINFKENIKTEIKNFVNKKTLIYEKLF
jgi:hypothetical protein